MNIIRKLLRKAEPVTGKVSEIARQYGFWHVKAFVHWFNHEHHHGRIKFVTPVQRHTGIDLAILRRRDALYTNMKKLNPARWSTTTRNWQYE